MAETEILRGPQGPVWEGADQVLPSIIVDADRCTGCGLCIPFCKPDVIRIGSMINGMGDHQMEIFRTGCTGCEMCAVVCPDLAIEVFKEASSGDAAGGATAVGGTAPATTEGVG